MVADPRSCRKISACILTFNEAEKINAVESALWADEVVVVGSNSTDGTAEIAARNPVVSRCSRTSSAAKNNE